MRTDCRYIRSVAAVAILVLPIVAMLFTPRSPWLLYNRTPSVPVGLYVRHGDELRRGDLVAFALPETAHAYAQLRGDGTDVLLLKPVLAIGGDHVSTLHGELRVNGAFVAAIPNTDTADRALPQCPIDRVLADGELFVGSAQHPHSFDSRFFGPVHASQIVGVYRRLTLDVSCDDTPPSPR